METKYFEAVPVEKELPTEEGQYYVTWHPDWSDKPLRRVLYFFEGEFLDSSHKDGEEYPVSISEIISWIRPISSLPVDKDRDALVEALKKIMKRSYMDGFESEGELIKYLHRVRDIASAALQSATDTTQK